MACADGKDGGSINYLYRLVYPGAEAGVVDKMQPGCLKLVSIIQKCKLKQSAATANSVVNKEEKNAYILSYFRRKIGEYERKTRGEAPHAHKPNGRPWKRIADQVDRNSLEWIHWGKFRSIWEFRVGKNDGQMGQILTIEEGGA